MSLARRRFLGGLVAQCGMLGSLGCKRPTGDRITIGAMPPGTSWYVFAATLAQLLQRSLPDATRVEVVARGGGIGNPILEPRLGPMPGTRSPTSRSTGTCARW